METITINSDKASGAEKKRKGNSKISDTTKAAMTTGAAGLAAGLAGKAIFDDITKDPEPEPIVETPSQNEAAPVELSNSEPEIEIYVNPDDVMIEDVKLDEDAEEISDLFENEVERTDEYRPMAEADPIDASEIEIVIEPIAGDEILIAENPEMDIEPIIEDNPSDDIICGLNENYVDQQIDEILNAGEDYLTDNNDIDFNEDYDIQSDLMA